MSRGSYLLFLSLLIISSVLIASKKLNERVAARGAAVIAGMKEGDSISAKHHQNMHKTAHPCIEECTEIFILECDDDKTKTTHPKKIHHQYGHTEMEGNNKWGMDKSHKRVDDTAGFRGNHNKFGIWDGDWNEHDEECDEEDDVEHSKFKKSKKGDHDDKDCDDEDSIELDEDEHHEKKQEDDHDKTNKEILKLKKLLKLYRAHHEEHHEIGHKKKNWQHKKKWHNKQKKQKKQKKQRKQRKHHDDEDCDDEDHHEKKQSKWDDEHHDEKEEHEDRAGFLERGQ
jgi:hypothetical protein